MVTGPIILSKAVEDLNTLAAAVVTTIPGLPTGAGISECPTGSACLPAQAVSGSSGLGVSGTSLDFSALAGVFVEILAIMSMAALVGILLIAVVANRADPDPTGRRPQSVYYFVVSFVTIMTSIFGSAVFVASILWLTAGHSASADHSISQLLLVSALVLAVSTTLFRLHLRRGLALARADSSNSNPSHRVGQSYVSIVAFVSILVLLVTSIFAIYLIFAVVSPSTFGSFGGRSISVRLLLELIYLALVAAAVLWSHSSLLTPRLGIFSKIVIPPSTPNGGLDTIAPPA
jgi:hypothetical protein